MKITSKYNYLPTHPPYCVKTTWSGFCSHIYASFNRWVDVLQKSGNMSPNELPVEWHVIMMVIEIRSFLKILMFSVFFTSRPLFLSNPDNIQ